MIQNLLNMEVNIYNVIWADDECATLKQDELIRKVFNEKRIEINMPFEQNIKEEDIPKRFYQMYHQVIDDVYHSLDIQQLKNIAHLLYHSYAITVYGVGSSLLTAQDFVMKCQI